MNENLTWFHIQYGIHTILGRQFKTFLSATTSDTAEAFI